MKQIQELLEASSEELPDIYCDMDQVLCNFMKGADEAVGSSFIHADKDERWNKINQTRGFWANLEWMPGGKRLWQFISRYDPYILSAYSGRDPTSKNGKLKWLAKNTNVKKGNINLVKRADKQKYAMTDGKPNILIDDYSKNIVEWEKKGGIGVHHTDTSDSLAKLKSLGFK
tara:strand:+ start:2366 stop:2881 length:516 start_codon:yes stop_codon:yes gene_type:complete